MAEKEIKVATENKIILVWEQIKYYLFCSVCANRKSAKF